MSETAMNEDRQKLITYLDSKVAEGKQFFRSKNIAQDIDLSPKQIGVHLAEHDGEGGIIVEKWTRSRSITWKVSRVAESQIN